MVGYVWLVFTAVPLLPNLLSHCQLQGRQVEQLQDLDPGALTQIHKWRLNMATSAVSLKMVWGGLIPPETAQITSQFYEQMYNICIFLVKVTPRLVLGDTEVSYVSPNSSIDPLD